MSLFSNNMATLRWGGRASRQASDGDLGMRGIAPDGEHRMSSTGGSLYIAPDAEPAVMLACPAPISPASPGDDDVVMSPMAAGPMLKSHQPPRNVNDRHEGASRQATI